MTDKKNVILENTNGVQIREDVMFNGHHGAANATCCFGDELIVAPPLFHADHKKGDPVMICGDHGVHAYRFSTLVIGQQPQGESKQQTITRLEAELAQANATIAALQACRERVLDSNTRVAAECEELEERELELLGVIEQMREALTDLTGVCITQVGTDYNDTIHAAYKKGKEALALTPDMTALVEHDSDCATYNMPAYPNGKCDCKLQPPKG